MENDYLWEGGPKMLRTEGFRLSTDSVLLGNFINLSGAKKGLDLGCASGILSLLLLSLKNGLHMTGVEIDEEECRTARQNMTLNGLSERSSIVCADLRNYRELFPAGSFDVIVSNPPYFPVGSGDASPDADRARARGEISCTLEDICRASEYLCRWGGKVAFVHKPERLSELLVAMHVHGIEAKRLRLISHGVQSAPSLVLVEGKRGAAPGLKIEKPLILTNPDGTDSEEIKRIYHR